MQIALRLMCRVLPHTHNRKVTRRYTIQVVVFHRTEKHVGTIQVVIFRRTVGPVSMANRSIGVNFFK